MNHCCELLLLVSLCWSKACRYDCITIGIISYGNGTVQTEIFSRHEQKFLIIKHLVDTREAFNVLRSVKSLDVNASVDVIALLDYEISTLKIPQILTSHNKRLIKLGANPRYIEKSREMEKTSNQDRGACENDSGGTDDIYCITDLNGTSIDRDNLLLNPPGPRAIRHLVQYFKWKRVVILYETSTEGEITTLVDGLSVDGVMFTIFNTEQIDDFHSLLYHIYQTIVKVNNEINVIIACRFQSTRNILKAANEFDSLNNEKTLLKKFAKWLIVLNGHGRRSLQVLQNCANDLDNIAVITIPDLRRIGIEEMTNLIETTILDTLKDQFGTKTHAKFKEDFINKLQENALSLDPTSKCNAYYIDTLLWNENGRQFSYVGYAETKGNVVVKSDIFPNARYGYNKRRFVVSTLPYSPFVIKRAVNNTYIYEGFCMDLLQELAHKLNFTFILTEPEDGNWGTFTDEAKVTFNGLVGQLQREEVNIVAAPLTRQAQRSPAMDFSYSYFYEYTTVLVKRPDVNAGKWRTLIDPLRWEVLVTIGITLLTVTVLVFLLEKNNPFYNTPEAAEERMTQGGLHELHSSFWYVFGALLCQGGVHLPLSTSGRTLISCWWLTCIIIVGTYSGNLIAFLTVTKEHAPFNTIAEMLKLKGTYKWGVIGGTNWEMILPTSANPTFKAVGEAFLEFSKTDPTILHQIPEFHINRVLTDDNYAWIGDKTYMEIFMARECSLMKIKEEFMPMIYIFGFTKNSPHTAIFSEQMLKIHEGGLFQIWKRKWWPKSNFCAGNSIPEAKPISLMDVQSAFYVCLIGIFLGTFAFVVEMVLYKYRLYRQKTGKDTKCDTTAKCVARNPEVKQNMTLNSAEKQTYL